MWHACVCPVLESLARPRATVAIQSLFSTPSDNLVQLLDLSGNCLDGRVGRPLAAMLRLNKVLTHLDLSNNFIDEDAGVAIAQALTANRKVRPQSHTVSR